MRNQHGGDDAWCARLFPTTSIHLHPLRISDTRSRFIKMAPRLRPIRTNRQLRLVVSTVCSMTMYVSAQEFCTYLKIPQALRVGNFTDRDYEAFLWLHLLLPTCTILIHQNPYSIEQIRVLHSTAVQELWKRRAIMRTEEKKVEGALWRI